MGLGEIKVVLANCILLADVVDFGMEANEEERLKFWKCVILSEVSE